MVVQLAATASGVGLHGFVAEAQPLIAVLGRQLTRWKCVEKDCDALIAPIDVDAAQNPFCGVPRVR